MPQRARYRIRTVSTKTGVPAATLRAWERRYGIPNPLRTESAYRLYRETDIEQIKLLKRMVDEGLAPSEAARLLKLKEERQAEDSESPSSPEESTQRDASTERSARVDELSAPRELLAHSEVTAPLEAAREQIFSAIRLFDPLGLEQAVRRSLLLGSARLVFDEIFAPVLRQVGEEWHQGRLSIAQEHLASEQIGNATRELLRLVQPDQRSRSIVLACIRGEFHVLPLYGSALHFVQYGYRVILLGSNAPPEALAHSINSLSPSAIGLSVTHQIEKETAKRLFSEYKSACGNCPIIVGGAGAFSLQETLEPLGIIVATGSPAQMQRTLSQRISRYEKEREAQER